MTSAGRKQDTIDVGTNFSVLIERMRAKQRGNDRVLLGICGAPGAGKSTLADRLVTLIGNSAVAIPMDGFHIATAALPTPEHASRRGAIDTFDIAGYLTLLNRLRNDTGEVVYAPAFDRRLEEPVAAVIPVAQQHRFVITEGNYLLSENPQWRELRTLFDETWYLELNPGDRMTRLVARHSMFGKSPEAAREMTEGSDETNARSIAQTRHDADIVLRLSTPEVSQAGAYWAES
jgi:pantothenate kinase